jgi:citrate synthase
MTEAVKAAGLRNVAVAESSISTIDGGAGKLWYRGFDIHALAEHSTFEETTFLLHVGRLPTRSELSAFGAELARQRALPAALVELLRALPAHAHPMASLRTAISALGALDPDAQDDGPAARARKAGRLTAQMATVVALIECLRKGQAAPAPDPSLPHATDFLRMLTGRTPDARAARAMDMALVLHADHEFNASTFAARVTASTLADMHAAVTAALGALKGPLHGGANEAVMQTLESIGGLEQVAGFVAQALATKRKLMGFGHAVYRTEDPRATHLRRLSRELGEASGEGLWFALSERLEAAVFAAKGLYPNVDFYSASAYRALGIPTDLFTPVFAVARIAGWSAHVLEQVDNNKLIRPEAEYVGARDLRYVPLAER